MTEEGEDDDSRIKVPTAGDDDEEVDIDPDTLEKLAEQLSSEQSENEQEYDLRFSTETYVEELDTHLYQSNLELISGTENLILINLTNQSDAEYPGGSIANLSFNLGSAGSAGNLDEYEIPSLEPNETTQIEISFHPTFDGFGGMIADIETDDGGNVIINDSDKNTLNTVFRAVPIERYMMVNDLREIKEILKENYE